MDSKTAPSWRLCAEPKHSKTYAFPKYWQFLLLVEGRKNEKLQQHMAERAGDTFEIRLRELRRLQTSQKGGSGLPKELQRLPPKVTRDIGGTAFGRLGGGNYPNLEATWSPKQTQAGDCVLSQNIAKPMLVRRFWQLFCLWRVGKPRNCSNRWLKELETRSK